MKQKFYNFLPNNGDRCKKQFYWCPSLVSIWCEVIPQPTTVVWQEERKVTTAVWRDGRKVITVVLTGGVGSDYHGLMGTVGDFGRG